MKPVSLCAILEKTNILKKYEKFKNIFVNDTKNLLLPKQEEWNHEIILKSGKKSTFGLIYFLSEKELAILKDYLNENLKKRHIRSLIFPAGYLIFLLRKKMARIDYASISDSWIILLSRTAIHSPESTNYSIECKK